MAWKFILLDLGVKESCLIRCGRDFFLQESIQTSTSRLKFDTRIFETVTWQSKPMPVPFKSARNTFQWFIFSCKQSATLRFCLSATRQGRRQFSTLFFPHFRPHFGWIAFNIASGVLLRLKNQGNSPATFNQ